MKVPNLKLVKRMLSWIIILVLVFTSVIGSGFTVFAETNTGSTFASKFASPGSDVKPKFRYWWPNAYVDLDEIRDEIKEIADAGFGGIEIADVWDSITIAESEVMDPVEYGYGTQRWKEAIETALEAAKDNGLQVDLTIGPHWPSAVNTITPDSPESSKELVYGQEILNDGVGFHGVIPDTSEEAGDDVNLKELVAVQAAKLTEITTKEVTGWGGTETVECYNINKDTMQDVTSSVYESVYGDLILDWDSPDNDDWIITTFWQWGTGQRTNMYYGSDAAKSPVGDPKFYVVDHFSEEGAQKVIDYWEENLLTDNIKELLADVGGAIFEDSLEIHTDTFWTPKFLEEFENRRGYDLTPYLPFILKDTPYSFDNDEDNEIISRAERDYEQTLSDLYIEKRVKTIKEWANGYGLDFRVQCYGASVDSQLAAASADIPEGESLAFGDDGLDAFRVLATGRDIGENKILSDEAGAYFGTAYSTTWEDLLSTLKKNYAAGVNQTVIHGFPYATAPGAMWPGFGAFNPGFGGRGFAEPWGPRMPVWEHISDISAYLARTQMVLQTGINKTDLAIYLENFDASGNTKAYTDTGLGEAGYSYQFFSPGLFDLSMAEVEDGILAKDGPGYKAFIINNQETMLLDSAKKILKYAEDGLPIVIVGDIPSKTSDKPEGSQDEDLEGVFEELVDLNNVVQVDTNSDVAEALMDLGVEPAAEYSETSDMMNIHRQDDGMDLYYLYNSGTEDVDMDVTFNGNGQPYVLDSWSGKITPIVSYTDSGDLKTIHIKLSPEETTIIGFTEGDELGDKPSYYVKSSEAEVKYINESVVARTYKEGTYNSVLSNGKDVNTTFSYIPEAQTLNNWNLSVESWTPENPEAVWNPGDEQDIVSTVKTTIDIGETELLPWNQIEDLEGVSGIGTYSATLNLDDSWTSDYGGYLDLGEVFDTFRVKVNDSDWIAADMTKAVLDIGEYLHSGSNTIVVEVASTLNNVINATPSLVERYSQTEDQDYGLIGPVQFIPYAQKEISTNELNYEAVMEADTTKGSMFRWWLPAALVEYDEIDAELQTIAEKGFRGVEICINMADSNYSQDDLLEYGWGTENWNKLYKYILKKANEYGVTVDTTISPAWPAAVPAITPESDGASKGLENYSSEEFTGSYNGAVPGPESYDENNKPALVAVTAAKVTGTDDVIKTKVTTWGDMPYNPAESTQTAELLDEDSMIAITDYVYDNDTGIYTINWTAPDEGSWKLFAFWMKGTEQENKQGDATYDPCYVVDHFGEKGAQALIDYWNNYLLDDETMELLKENGGAIFEDSLELDVDGVFWTKDFLEEFRERRGYDLTPYLPLLEGQSFNGFSNVDFYTYEFDNGSGEYSDLGDRIRNDYKQVLTDLYLEQHIKPIEEWAQSLGLTYRAQTYSSAIDSTQASAAALGPDVESLGFGPGVRGDDKYRMVAGGAHMADRNIISSEVGAIGNEGYRLTWIEMLEWISKGYSGGSNQMIFHGFPYSDTNSSVWPGYSPFGFGLAGYWGPREPVWDKIEDFADYLARTQEVLQGGKSKMDLAIYRHEYNTVTPLFEDQSMAEAGYTYDIISPNILDLPSAVVEEGVLNPDGPSYKAIIINNQTNMPVEAAQKLLDFASAGLKIIIVGNAPSKTSYFNNWEENDGELSDIIDELITVKDSVKVVESESDVVEALKEFGIDPSAQYEESAELSSVHRLIDGMDYYYLYNYGDTDIDTNITFEGTGYAYSIDQWSGEISRIAEYSKTSSTITANIKLIPQETTIVAFGSGNSLISGSPSYYAKSISGDDAEVIYDDEELAVRAFENGTYSVTLNKNKANKVKIENLPDEKVLDSGWSLVVESWENADNGEKTSETKKTTIDIGETDLIPWKDIESLGDGVSGIGIYTNTFTLDSGWNSADGAYIDLGNVYGCSSELWVNGTKVAVNQYTNTADIGSLLKTGDNTISIEVTSTLGNRLIADGSITAPVWDTSATVDYENYGITGPVIIVPYVEEKISISESDSDSGSSSKSSGGSSKSTATPTPTPTPVPEEETELNTEPVSETKDFKDLSGYSWAQEAIEALAELGVIKGTSDTTFDPGKNIKRADFMLLLVRALSLTADADSNFTDVDENSYYADALRIAKKLGIANGMGDGTFNPEGEISRQDMMVLVVRALKAADRIEETGTSDDIPGFDDTSQISDYALSSVATLVKEGLIKGDGSNINPKGTATRAEIAVIIYRLLNK